eukprot:gb/GECH01001441.1/.p1 GENE.gb/GECH01001441.1/~~gb/GECH01001441.1/.p1  ORF type:complete len:560 (+),score=107.94 gb/GECH01001441.1/:1-1680(+)
MLPRPKTASLRSKDRSRVPKYSTHSSTKQKEQQEKKIDLAEYIEKRDFTGAIAILEFYRSQGEGDERFPTLPWLGYCALHAWDFEKATEVFEELSKSKGDNAPEWIFLGISLYFQGKLEEAKEAAEKGPQNSLRTRLLFHIANRMNDEKELMACNTDMKQTIEDKLSMAAVYYYRTNYDQAGKLYKSILMDNSGFHALNVYIAMCYYNLDYFDVVLECLDEYLKTDPLSASAVNLRACSSFQLYNGKVAESELRTLIDTQMSSYGEMSDIVRHNLMVFRNGENAKQILHPLVGSIHEARLNLVIYYLRENDVNGAFQLIKELEPSAPQEYILAAIVHALIGQMTDSREHLIRSHGYFQIIGSSPSECNTLHGRQCMASSFFLIKQFKDAVVYLNSIREYSFNDDTFNWNLGLALANSNYFGKAEKVLLTISSEEYRNDFCFLSWLARCYIMNEKASLAWDLYVNLDSSDDSLLLLQIIANDCYRIGSFYYSAKAFDVLERLDPNPEYWHGKRGACIGVFQLYLAQKENLDNLRDVVDMLRNTSNPQAEHIITVISRHTM